MLTNQVKVCGLFVRRNEQNVQKMCIFQSSFSSTEFQQQNNFLRATVAQKL